LPRIRFFGQRIVGNLRPPAAVVALGPPPLEETPAVSAAPPRFPEHHPRLLALRNAFTPMRPQRSFRRVAGRKNELLRILDAISENRSHVVLYGDRGRGKTSIVNLVAAAARSSGYMVGRYSCDHDSDFDDIIRGLVKDLPRSALAVPVAEDNGLEGCEAALPRDRLQPRDIVLLPSRLIGGHVLLIIDEFDRVADVPTRTHLADTIKQISDRAAPLSFLIVGVSDSLEDLLGHHPSIQRNVAAVPLPLLTDADANEIIEIGAREAQLDYPQRIRKTIIRFARGVPYVVHLLALHLGEQALRRGVRFVDRPDILPAFERAVAELSPHVSLVYYKLTKGESGTEMRALLLKLALAEHDRFGLLPVEQNDNLVRVAGQTAQPALWQRLLDTGAVRPCRGGASGLFTFADPMLLHYVLLHAVIDSELPGGAAKAEALI
jgi:hypothetical protein